MSYAAEESRLKEIAARRNDGKVEYNSSLYMNPKSHYLGVLGEWCLSQLTGIPFDENEYAAGDGGSDFHLVDVKGSSYWRSPDLKLFEKDLESTSDYFALAAVNEPLKQVRYVGFISKADFKSKMITKNYGHGKRLVIEFGGLIEELPPISALTTGVSDGQ